MARPKKERYYARRPMKYAGVNYARGQVLERGLIGARNDEKLVAMGYVVKLDGNAETFTHADTGAEFISIGARTAYGDRLRREQAIRNNSFNSDHAEDQLAELEKEAQEQADKEAPVIIQEAVT